MVMPSGLSAPGGNVAKRCTAPRSHALAAVQMRKRLANASARLRMIKDIVSPITKSAFRRRLSLRRGRQRRAAGSGGECERRLRRLLSNARHAPVAYPAGERDGHARELRGG